MVGFDGWVFEGVIIVGAGLRSDESWRRLVWVVGVGL